MGFLLAISYVVGLFFPSGTGQSNYKSSSLEKVSLKTRGSKSLPHNPHLPGENGKSFAVHKADVRYRPRFTVAVRPICDSSVITVFTPLDGLG